MAFIQEILNYTPQQWRENQRAIAAYILNGRESLGLGQEWVAVQAGYSLVQYQKLETGERFIELYDFLRIGEVFYLYQESLLPPYQQIFDSWILWVKTLPWRFSDWLDSLRYH